MAVNERTRHDLYEAARRAMGDEAAETLMEMLPPVGWADVATKQDLAALEERMDLRFELVDERFGALEERMDLRFERQEARFDTRLHRELRRLEARFTATLFVGLTAFGVIDRAL